MKPSTTTRRRLLASTTTTAIAAALAGCAATQGATDEPANDGELTGDDEPTADDGLTADDEQTNDDEPTSDGEPTTDDVAATVVVGPSGEFRFEPETVTVDPGDTVEWRWDSDNHNLAPRTIPEDADWSGTDDDERTVYDRGHTYRHTFDVAGTYEYACEPHRSVGMTGSVAVGDVETTTTTTAERVVLGEDEPATVAVGPQGEFRFEPGTDVVPVVRPGTEVTFVWESDNHSITVDATPDGANWTGTGSTLHDAGHEHVHEFAVEGRYDFYCEPHESVGMTGALVVESA